MKHRQPYFPAVRDRVVSMVSEHQADYLHKGDDRSETRHSYLPSLWP